MAFTVSYRFKAGIIKEKQWDVVIFRHVLAVSSLSDNGGGAPERVHHEQRPGSD